MVPGASGQNPAERHRWFVKAGTCNARQEEGQKQDMERRGKKEGGERDEMKIVADSQPNGRQGEEEAHSILRCDMTRR